MHNYTIFFFAALYLTASSYFLQTNLLVTKLRLPRRFSFGSYLLQYSMEFFRNRLIVFAFWYHYLQTNFCQRI